MTIDAKLVQTNFLEVIFKSKFRKFCPFGKPNDQPILHSWAIQPSALFTKAYSINALQLPLTAFMQRTNHLGIMKIQTKNATGFQGHNPFESV